MTGNWQRGPRPQALDEPLNPYTGESVDLGPDDRAFLARKYQVSPIAGDMMIDLDSNRYVMPVRGPTGDLRGHQLRVPWEGAPRETLPLHTQYPKAYTAKSGPGPMQAFYGAYNYIDPNKDVLILVEDQLSGMKAAAYGLDSVALLGKPHCGRGSDDRIAELVHIADGRPVILALDFDALDSAVFFARTWDSAFKALRIAVLPDDLKDLPLSEWKEVLGV